MVLNTATQTDVLMEFDRIVDEINGAESETELMIIFYRHAEKLTDILLDLGGQIEGWRMDFLESKVYRQ